MRTSSSTFCLSAALFWMTVSTRSFSAELTGRSPVVFSVSLIYLRRVRVRDSWRERRSCVCLCKLCSLAGCADRGRQTRPRRDGTGYENLAASKGPQHQSLSMKAQSGVSGVGGPGGSTSPGGPLGSRGWGTGGLPKLKTLSALVEVRRTSGSSPSRLRGSRCRPRHCARDELRDARHA